MQQPSVFKRLSALRDEPYRAFQCSLMPTVDPETVIGVRTPALRRLAGELAGTPSADDFLNSLPHRFYEENNLHGLLINRMGDYEECVKALDAFLPYVDNWATCDLLRPKAFAKRPEQLPGQISIWMADRHPFTVRFGLEMLMTYYLDDAFAPLYLDRAAAPRPDDYYVCMMQAWFFATALAKHYEAALPFLREGRLDPATHNKAIQKAVESRRLTDAQKDALRALRLCAPQLHAPVRAANTSNSTGRYQND